MLTPEIALFAAVAALMITLVNSLVLLAARRGLRQEVEAIRTELDASLSASHGLARHVRQLQRAQNEAPAQPTDKGADVKELDEAVRAAAEDEDLDAADTRSLAEKLGLSQSEAEIITHLRPHRKRRVQETA